MKDLKEFCFSDFRGSGWYFKKYYYSGSNSRYWTFQLALNLLYQKVDSPIIIETGCQRQEDDIGAGMSTSIFGEYCLRYGGRLYTIDLFEQHLKICKSCTEEYSSKIEYVLSDSISWLSNSNVVGADLIYLDSLDYPISADGLSCPNMLEAKASQEHCLNEFKACEKSGKIKPNTIVLLDDNQLPAGGKPLLLKEYLSTQGWICLLDFQQSLWVRQV